MFPSSRMPIAEVARDTAGRAALEEVAREMSLAEEEGRVVKRLPLAKIQPDHLRRDRLVIDPEEMDALVASLSERGQQTPIEVVALAGEEYGLISGLRRIEALKSLGQSTVLALVRREGGAQAAYQAMVEENEIRANLSFFERANIVAAAVEQGVFPHFRAALNGLFGHTTPAKRSKIAKFAVLRQKIGGALKFPAAIPEKLGLALAQELERDEKLARQIARDLKKSPPETAEKERTVLERSMRRPATAKSPPEELSPGLFWGAKAGRGVLSGPAVDADMLKAVREFLISRAKKNNVTT